MLMEELRKRFIGEGVLILFAQIREQGAALAEARTLIKWIPEIATSDDGDGQLDERARAWLLAHPAPK